MSHPEHRHAVDWKTIADLGDPRWKRLFAEGGRSTVALLAADGRVAGPGPVQSGGGLHAEERLLSSAAWHSLVGRIIGGVAAPAEVVLAMNRTPCHGHGCSAKLASALRRLEAASRAAMPRFVLACTGVYETAGPLENRADQGPTTNRDLRALASSGWILRALSFDGRLSARGRILAEYVPHVEAWVASRAPQLAPDGRL